MKGHARTDTVLGGVNGVCGFRGSNLATYSLTTTDMDTHSSEAKKQLEKSKTCRFAEFLVSFLVG